MCSDRRIVCCAYCIGRYFIMVLYVVLALSRWNHNESQGMFGLVGLALVVVSTIGAFGFATLLGIKFNATSTQVRHV